MTTKECFDAMGADYEGVLERFSSEALVKKFALKFWMITVILILKMP